MLNGYLSKLRRLLANGDGSEVLATQAPGYVLRVPAERLDARRFEALREQGREALRRGDAEQAAAALQAALSLWRGPALADLAYEAFAQTEIRRLEELRLAALEDRIEAELALGRHEGLVAELEALIAEHPYRERLHAQLMLALYRSGRQAEALDAYRRARRTFAEQLGIDPGPRLQELEQAILRHDASLEPPQLPPSTPAKETPRPPPRPRPRRTTIAIVLAAGVVLALAAAAVVALRNSSTSSPKSVRLAGNSVAIVDPATNSIVREVPVGGRPTGIAVGYGSVWIGNRDERTVLRIDSSSRKIVRRFGLGSIPVDLAAGAGSVWVLTETSRVVRIDPDSNGIAATIALPLATDVRSHMAVGGGGVWVAHGGAISRIEPTTNKVATVREGFDWRIAYGEDALWAVTGNQIEQIDPKTNEVLHSISLPQLGRVVGLGGVAASGGALWSGTGADLTLFKIDPAAGRVIGGVSLGYRIGGALFDEGDVWIAGKPDTLRYIDLASDGVAKSDALLRVDLASERVVKTIPLGVRFAPARSATGPIAIGEGAVWITTIWP